MTWVKICGTTNVHDAQLSVAAGADALGFIFAPSPRNVDITTASRIVSALRGQAEMIGVFVNDSPERVAEIAEQVGLTGVQLHGDEPTEKLPEFRRALGERKVIKTLRAPELLRAAEDGAPLHADDLAEESAEHRRIRSYRRMVKVLHGRHLYSKDESSPRDFVPAAIDAILLDSGSSHQAGGTGLPFNWEAAVLLSKQIQKTMPLIIAGGLNAANVAEVIELFGPWGIDVASGVESSPGRKDENKLQKFVAKVRQMPASVRQRE